MLTRQVRWLIKARTLRPVDPSSNISIQARVSRLRRTTIPVRMVLVPSRSSDFNFTDGSSESRDVQSIEWSVGKLHRLFGSQRGRRCTQIRERTLRRAGRKSFRLILDRSLAGDRQLHRSRWDGSTDQL